MITKCPNCNIKFKVRDEYKGKKTKCPKCKQPFTIDEFIAKPAPLTRVKCISKKKCVVCGESFSDDEILQTIDNNFICRRCFKEQQEQQTSGTGKKKVLFLSVAGVLILVVGIAFYFLFLDTDRPDSLGESQTPVTREARWPFTEQIPNGFQFERRQEWKDRTFWILRGEQFGQARETLIVVKLNPETLTTDTQRAPYWAAELCVDCPLGESSYNQRETLENQKYSIVIIPYFDEQVLFSPGQRSELAKVAGLTGPMDQVMRSIPLEGLGRPKDYVPGTVNAWAGSCHGTLLVVAWAGDSHKVDIRNHNMLAELCYELRLMPEESFKAPEAPSTSRSNKRGRSAEIPTDRVYSSNASSGGSYTDVIHGFFQVEPPKGFRIEEDRNRTTTRLDNGIVVPCSRIRFESGKARIAVVTRKTFKGTIEEDSKVAVNNLRSAGAKIVDERFVTIDGSKGIEVDAIAGGYRLLLVKYKKHGLDHAITISCSPAGFSSLRKEFTDFLCSYRSVNKDQVSDSVKPQKP